MGRGSEETSLGIVCCTEQARLLTSRSRSEVTEWKTEPSGDGGPGLLSGEEKLLWFTSVQLALQQCGTHRGAGLFLLLGTMWLQRKGLGAHIPAPYPQWALRKSGSGRAELRDTQGTIAAGHMFVECLHPETYSGSWGRHCGMTEVERMRPFCFILGILSELMYHCFYCCLCGLSHHHPSLGDTKVAVSLFLRQAFRAIVCDLPFAGGLLPRGPHGSSFAFCLRCLLFSETCSSHPT